MDTQLEKIIQYLENELSPAERASFEEKLRKDEVLVKEVAFQRGLHGFLGRNNPALEQKMSDLGDEFILKSPTRKYPVLGKVLLALFLIGLLAYGLFFYNKPQAIKDIVPPETKIEKVDPMPNEEDEITIPPELPEETIKEIIVPIEAVEKPTIPIDQPIATLDKAAFERNPILETVMKESYRANNTKAITNLSLPSQDAIFEYAPFIPLIVAGESTIAPNYDLILYSNRSYEIENDYKVLNVSLTGEQENDKYAFRFNGKIPLERGLYYLVIRKTGSRDILHISRFSVR